MDGTLVIGHRGSPRKALENSIESFDQAEADGANGVELDVRMTADGELVVHHDAELLRGDRRIPIGSLTFREVSETEVERGGHSGRVPALRDVLLRYAGSLRYLVELKSGPSPRPSLLEFKVAALLTQLHLLEKATVLSFAPEILRRIKEIQPLVATCLVFDGTAYRPEGQLWPILPRGCEAIAPNVALASERQLQTAREAGLAVHVWTVNDEETATRLAHLGATSVITDVPADVGPAIRAVAMERLPA
jgi:glycerophosphoryl diester phosphodiesterase